MSENAMKLTGRVLSGLVVLILLLDAATPLLAPDMARANMEHGGFAMETGPLLSAIMLLCAMVYAVPRTAVLGAILITGFCGGAICTHVRIGEAVSPPVVISLVLGVAAWGGLYLRDARVRALLRLSS